VGIVFMELEWTIRENEQNVVHQELLGEGGYGEVHKVSLSHSHASAKHLDVEYEYQRGTKSG
jgi:hypothetical protein